MVKTKRLKKYLVLQVFIALAIMASTGTLELSAGTLGLSVNSGQHTIQNGDDLVLLEAAGTANVDIIGGAIEAHLFASDSAVINISGGNLFWGDFNGGPGFLGGPFQISGEAQATIIGSNFTVGGEPVFGVLDLDALTTGGFLTLVSNAESDNWIGQLSGMLQGGMPLDVEFTIVRSKWSSADDANITIIPEPVSVMLLSFGSFLLRRRISSNTHLN